MKDSRKLKKKPKKFKFKKASKSSQDEKLKLQKKAEQQNDLKKSLPYNRSFIKNFLLSKKDQIKKEKPKETTAEITPKGTILQHITIVISKFKKKSSKESVEETSLITESSITESSITESSITESSITEELVQDNQKQSSIWQVFLRTYKRIENDLLLILIPVVLILILALLNLMNKRVVMQLSENRLSDIDYQVNVHPYPIAISPINPYISAQTAIVMEKDSKVILYAKNPTVKFSMASTTKLMTALVGLDYYHPDSVLTIKTPHVEGSNLGFYAGEQFTFKDLLYAMMLPSSNEAAYAVAENYPGGKEAFIEKMNEKAKQLHLQNTNYGDPAGLDDDQNFSTVVDLARLASVGLESPLLSQIVDTKEHILVDKAGRQLPIHSLNQLLGIDGINGVKTGTTEAAGEVLITSTLQNGHTYIIVVMRSDQRFADTLNLVHALTNNVNYIQPQFVSQISPMQ